MAGPIAGARGSYRVDRFALPHAFLITAACERYVLFYAVRGCRPGTPRSA